MTERQQRRLAAILAADIAGYSALMGADEEATVRDLKAHQGVILPMIKEQGGRVIDTAGDGVLAEFASVLNAVKCAVAIQKTMADRNAAIEHARRMQFRIGINLGDVVFDDVRIYGDGINIAARLEAIAEPGGICISGNVFEEIRTKLDLEYHDIGEQQLKNIAHPVRVYRARKRAASTPIAMHPLSLPDKPSIAVLPFTNMSGDPDQEFFGDGIAEDVLTELSRLRWLFVIARNSSFTYKDKAVDIKQVGRDLGIRYVLEGSVRRAGGRVRITGQLIDVTTGAHIWAERYDRDLADIVAAQDEITAAVASAIGPAIVHAERQRAVRKLPETLGTWEAYQRGMWHMSKHDAVEIELARTFFQRAVDLDPSYAPGYGALAWSYVVSGGAFSSMTNTEWVSLAEPLARKAVALDENDADARARLALAIFMKGDIEGGMQEAEHALSINANCADAIGVKGAALVFSGRREEGREAIQLYLRLSPRDPARPIRLAQIAASQYLDGDYEAAVLTARQVIRQHPKNPSAHRWLAASLGQLGRATEAKEVLQTLLTLAPSSLDMYVRQRPPFWRVADHEHFLDGLRKAGWQDQR